MFEQYLKNSRLYGNNSDPKFALSVQLWLPVSAWRWPESKKKIYSGKALTIGLSEYIKSKALSPFPFKKKIQLLFSLFGLLLAGKKTWSSVEESESKFDIPYWSLAIPGQPNVKNVVPALSSFAAIGTKEYSSVKFNPYFHVWLLVWLPRQQFWKKWVGFIPLVLFSIS